jgi:hypothetical protein
MKITSSADDSREAFRKSPARSGGKNLDESRRGFYVGSNDVIASKLAPTF